MVPFTGRHKQVGPYYHKVIQGVALMLVHQKPQRLQQLSCNRIPFYPEIREMSQYGTIGKMFPLNPLQVNDPQKKLQGYVWYQDDIFLAYHRLLGKLEFVTTRRNKIKYPNMIELNHWKEFKTEVSKKGIKNSDFREAVPLDQ